MASSYTTREQFVLQATGENLNTWGTLLNNSGLQLVDDAIAGYVTVEVSSITVTLTRNQGSTDQDRMMGVQINGTLTSSIGVVVASVSKMRVVKNNTSGNFTVTMKTLGGTGTVVPQGKSLALLCDTVSVFPVASPVDSHNFLTPPGAYSPYIALTPGTSIPVDMGAGINFVVTLTGNGQLENPTNCQPGTSGIILVVQNVSGSKTLSFGTAWKFAGGTDPTMSTSAGAVDVIPYQVYTSSFIVAGAGLSFS